MSKWDDCPGLVPVQVSRSKVLPPLQQSTHQMWIPQLLQDANIVQLDIQVLIDWLECAFDADIVLELHDNFLIDQGLEETERAS